MSFSRIDADWPAPSNVLAFNTCRDGGISTGNFASLNFGMCVGDAVTSVRHNRNLLQQGFQDPLIWIQQVHGPDVVALSPQASHVQADAIYTNRRGQPCIIKTADCLPILICNRAGTEVAAIHGSWRCLASGIVANTIQVLQSSPADLLIWFGPAIGPSVYEVGSEVLLQFQKILPATSAAFQPGRGDRYYLDLVSAATILLRQWGVQHFYGGGYCTYSDSERFFSYRRDTITGRMASVVCLQ